MHTIDNIQNREKSSTDTGATQVAMLFDLDGVLVDSESRYTEIWDDINSHFPTGVENFSRKIKGMTLTEIFNVYFPDTSTHAPITEMLNYAEQRMKYDLKPGVETLLQTLQDRNIPAVMVTSSNDLKMSKLWRQQPQLRDYFRQIITADMITHSKPDPEGYLLGARLAECPPERCAVFEDSAQGVKAGHLAGAMVIGVSGTLTPDKLEPWADFIVDTLEGFDVDALVAKLSNR